MSTDNLISVEFTQDEQNKINEALSCVEKILKNKVVNLTPKEKQMYGKIGNKTENWVLKVHGYMQQKPQGNRF